MGSSTLYLTTLLTALGFMLIGYDNGVMGKLLLIVAQLKADPFRWYC